MHKIIVFEGQDGVGKTTLAKHIAKKFDYEYVKIPPENSVEKRKYIELYGSPKHKFSYYISSINDTLLSFNKSKTYIIDRYIYSSIISYASNLKNGINKELFTLFASKFPEPTIVFQISCDNIIRIKRIKDRGKNQTFKDDISDIFLDYNLKYYSFFQKKIKHWHVIDNSHLMQQAIDRIESLLLTRSLDTSE